MSFLVAGSTGLVGSSVMRLLEERGLEAQGVSSTDANLCDRDEAFSLISKKRPRVLIMAAAKVGGIVANQNRPVDFLSINIQIQTNLLDAAHTFDVERVVFLGSSCIYPRECPQPIREEYLMTGPLEPTNSPYAIAKISGVELVKAYRRQFGHSWISLMPTNLYGSHDNFDLESSHVLPAMIRKFHDAKIAGAKSVTLWGSGNPTREFLYVDDLASAILHCVSVYDEQMPLNVGTGVEVSINELATTVSRVLDYEGQILWDKVRPDGTPRKVLDVTRLNSIGWKHETNLEEGILKTYDWFTSNYIGKR